MKHIGLATLGTAIHFCVALAIGMTGIYSAAVALMLLSFAFVSALGIALAATGFRRIGGQLVIAGAVPFLPIGIVAVLGGRKLIAVASRRRVYGIRLEAL